MDEQEEEEEEKEKKEEVEEEVEEGLTQRRRENDADEIERRVYTVESRYGRYVRTGVEEKERGEGDLFFSPFPLI